MKKLLVLVPVFIAAACGEIDVHLGETANAQSSGGNGGDGGSGESGSCECKIESFDGTRLEKKHILGEDGSRAEYGMFYDKEKGVDCTFYQLPNGETRCVPPHAPMNMYADSACTVPVYIYASKTLECDKLPPFVRFDEYDHANSCGGKVINSAFYAPDTGNKMTLVNWWSIGVNGTCDPKGASGGYSYAMYGLYKIADQAGFVRGSYSEAP